MTEINNYEEKMGYYFSNALHARLKNSINAHVWCRIIDDRLTVEIAPKYGNLQTQGRIHVTYLQDNILEMINQGVTADEIAKCVERKYRRTINSIFFKKGNSEGGTRDVTDEFIKECE